MHLKRFLFTGRRYINAYSVRNLINLLSVKLRMKLKTRQQSKLIYEVKMKLKADQQSKPI